MKTILSFLLGLALPLLGVEVSVPLSGNGNSAIDAPWGVSSMRYQQVYSASAFSSLTPVGGGWITAISFRVEDTLPFTPAEAQINFSTTSRPVDDLCPVFAENVGADDRAVIGPGFISFVPPIITLATPFFYNPAAGNLLMDVRMSRGLIGVQGPIDFDATDIFGDATSVLYAFDTGASSGVADTIGLVTIFQIEPVPEPSFTILALAALVTAFVFGLRKQHKPSTRKV